ncbi:LLM class flavin-dependent oxidoreductase [Ilumatobacter coccineus]|uniref:LLM class flavin-dependent oxidoreductase n=1 Tax=Ilumatobacter coccineus TaxID=467094 RepID=UPI00138AB582|nr:LLM class flavin-dependent oxidoreductase [Ilumatobacter coccineus]
MRRQYEVGPPPGSSEHTSTLSKVRYTVNLVDADVDPRAWAAEREAEGWHGLSVADHFFTDTRAYPHVWVSAAAMAAATTRATISTAFANNLFRSPVEVAQAALQLQVVSDGRFELGLGAGWSKSEAIGASIEYPAPGVRAGRYAEAAHIVRTLLHTNACTFAGEHYTVDVPVLGPAVTPPPLIGSVGGPRTMREVTPHLDRVELKVQSAATRGGALDLGVMASIPASRITDMIEQVRAVNPDIEISMFVLCSVGDDPRTKGVAKALASGGLSSDERLFERFFGSPEHVAEGLDWLETMGVSAASITGMTDESLPLLAPHLHLD